MLSKFFTHEPLIFYLRHKLIPPRPPSRAFKRYHLWHSPEIFKDFLSTITGCRATSSRCSLGHEYNDTGKYHCHLNAQLSKENLTHALPRRNRCIHVVCRTSTAHRKSRNNGKSRTYCDSVRTKENGIYKPVGIGRMYCTYKTGLDYHYIYAVIRRGNARDYSFWHGEPKRFFSRKRSSHFPSRTNFHRSFDIHLF